ncbi:MAG: cytochrome c oxidase accessory protein CcoG [Bdellovibrionaceae bacterium]|nr:cytochrome c oxidase accessory protein CcoG [Pseudobdellovibrionaceae bacterium]NUM57830.1 cytochrome c oxidase accessory protein CcoG [Pseudobdellovibrionaceae bacterium]
MDNKTENPSNENNNIENNLGLDPERLSMLDDQGHKKVIIPAEVKGFWRNKRDYFYAVLILFFLILPWTKINNTQTILLDLPNRKFAIFGVTFWAHDAPMVFFVLAFFTIGLAFITSIWGRVWCGWACPQTVFIDFIYRRIEKWIEGNYIQRRELEKQDMNFKKFIKKITKWFLFFIVSSLIAHSFAAYFVGSVSLTEWILSGDISLHMTTFLIVSSITLVLLFDFGWFREQFCIIMCPYGRFQSVLMDHGSLAVLYDEKRGEPRKGLPASADGKKGDCVSCNRCVQVCPTGIDIRKGLQMECIACTACIDACDEIMEKVKKPKGLIKYNTISEKQNKIFSARSLIYLSILVLSGISLSVLLYNRTDVHVALLRATDSPYQIIKNNDGSEAIMNHFKLHIKNQGFEDKKYKIDIPQEFQNLNLDLKIPENPVSVKAGSDKTIHLFIVFKKDILQKKGDLKLRMHIKDDLSISKESTDQSKDFSLVGPS